MSQIFLLFASTLVIASLLGIAARIFKQPLILAYIVTGILISLTGVLGGVDETGVAVLSNIGIAFLLFLVGVELEISDLKYVGKVAVYGGLGQIIFTTIVGFILISALGFSAVVSFILALAITFSSTVIIIRLLAEKNDLQSLHGKIIVGFLLVQDFVAIVALMFLAGFENGRAPDAGSFLLIFVKGLVLVAFVAAVSKYFLRLVLKKASESSELLFVTAIAWAFLVSAIAERVGFSIAIGAFLAGVAVASSPFRTQISGRIKPLRDFFLVIFFILLGASMPIATLGQSVGIIIILSVFVLLGKALIVFAIMLTLKFRNRTAFLSAISVVQISEFSLILLAFSKNLGFIGSREVAIVGAVGIITITISSYLILFGDKIYNFVSRPMSRIFPEKLKDPYVANREKLEDHVVLVGGEQMGSDILDYIKNKIQDKDQIVVVDFNPDIYTGLKATGYNAVFGDVTDPEVLEELELGRARLLIITDPDASDSARIIQMAKTKNFKGPIVGTAYWIHDAIKLYELGADYVVVPETVGGKHVARILAEHWEDLGKIKKEKSKHFEDLMSHKIF